MTQDDPVSNNNSTVVGDNKSTTADPAQKRRRRPRRRKSVNRATGGASVGADMAVTDVSLASAEVEEETSKPFVDDEIEEKEIEPAPISPPTFEPVATPPSYEPASTPSYEPSPFDLAASFDHNSNPYSSEPPQSKPSVETVAPSPFPPINEPTPSPTFNPVVAPTLHEPAPVPAPSYEPLPFDLSQPSAAPSSFESTPAPILEPTPAPQPTQEPSPFDLASSYGKGGNDGFGDYQSPFGEENFHQKSKSDLSPASESVVHEPAEKVESKKQPEEKIKNSEIVEGEVVREENVVHPETGLKEESLDSLAMEGSLLGKVEKLLQEANLTPRHLKFCCGGVLLVILIILGGVFLAPKLLGRGQVNDEGSEQTSVEEEPEEEVASAPTPVIIVPADTIDPNEVGWVDPSVYSGILLGDQGAELEGSTGVDIGVLVGEDDKVDYSSKLQIFITDLEGMYNLYNVDVKALLDGSKNRTRTLDDHIAKMKEFYNLGIEHYEELGTMKADLSVQFDENALLKDEAETKVFDALGIQVLDGEEVEEQLNSFILYKQNEADLKARYYVLGNLEVLYEKILSGSYNKIKDFELNREALIVGVQVVDVEGSDIDLIFTEFDLEK